MGTQGQKFVCLFFKMIEMKTRRDRIQNSSRELILTRWRDTSSISTKEEKRGGYKLRKFYYFGSRS